jgi:hypothetical protein
VNTASLRVLGIAVGLALSFAATLATKLPQANASEDLAPTSNRMGSTGNLSPIGLSPSQDTVCKRTPQSAPHHSDCNEAIHVLALMSAERRDNPWAERMESFLSKWVESLASEGMTPRDIECRLSWCIVELGSAPGPLTKIPPSQEKVFYFLALFAPDLDDPNQQDILLFFKRYCKSYKELFDDSNVGHLAPDFDTVGTTCP